MSAIQPDLLVANPTFTHAGAANTVQTDVILPAPGAGFRWRLWSLDVTRNPVQIVAADGHVIDAPNTVGFFRWAMAIQTQSDHSDAGAGGVAAPTNTGISMRWRANAAAGTIVNLIVRYSQERA